MGAMDVCHRGCQAEVGQWPLHGTLFDLFSVVERESFLPRGWTLISSLDFGDEKGITFAHVKREIGGDRMLCDKTVTVNPIKEDLDAAEAGAGLEEGIIAKEVGEILLQVVAKVFPAGRGYPATNFTVTQIHSLADIVTILTDSSTYSDGIQMQGERPEEDYNHYHLGAPSPDSPSKPNVGGTIAIQSHDFLRADENNFFTEVVDSITLDDGDTDSDDVYPVAKRYRGEEGGPSEPLMLEDDWPDSPMTSAPSQSTPTRQRAPRTNFSAYPKSDDPDRPFQCPQCPSKFKRANHFKDHLRVHKDESFQCPVCPFTCKLQTLFTNHMTNKHNGKGPFPCPECPQEFERVHDLARHLPRDHKIDTGFKLSHFERSFDSPYGARPGRPRGGGTALAVASNESRKNLKDDFDFGDASFEDMQRLMRLYGEFEEESPSMVPRSGRAQFGSDTPSPRRPGRPVGSASRSRGRPRSNAPLGLGFDHGDEDNPPDPSDAWVRQYYMGCRRCGVDDLGTEQQFSQHFLNVHNDDRPYKCQDLKKEGCKSSFRMRTTYKEHIRGVHHPEIKHFKCKTCAKRYSTRSGLTQHTLQHSQFRCPVCRMRFLTSRAMTRHMEETGHVGEVGALVPASPSNGGLSDKDAAASNGRSSVAPLKASNNAASPSLKRSLNDVAMALADDADRIGVKSLADEMDFEAANENGDVEAGAVSSVFPERSVFPEAMTS